MKTQIKNIKEYYRFHGPIYDLTRWTFLFGREDLAALATSFSAPASVLEVGCGTGHMIRILVRMIPEVRVTGIDASPVMLSLCSKKLKKYDGNIFLFNRNYTEPVSPDNPYDMVLFSYSLSMFGNGCANAVRSAISDLRPGGLITVVDFHQSPFLWFRKWMALNHVALKGKILPVLEKEFSTLHCRITDAYGGLWSYFQYIGRKAD